MMIFWRLSVFMILLLAGCSGGSSSEDAGQDDGGRPDANGADAGDPGSDPGGPGSSHFSLEVDEFQAECLDMTFGVDAEGRTVLLCLGTDSALEISFPGTIAGSFTSESSGGGRISYTIGGDQEFSAYDDQDGSSYSIDIQRYDAGQLDGSYLATLLDAQGQSHAVQGSFHLVPGTVEPSLHYQGSYFGIFRLCYAVWDMQQAQWGPEQSLGFRATIRLDYQNSAGTNQYYDVEHVLVSDEFFGCQMGCTPVAGTQVGLPEVPGTMPSFARMAIAFPNDSMLVTQNQIYTSTDARTLGESLETPINWDAYDYLNSKLSPDATSEIREASWRLSRSAL